MSRVLAAKCALSIRVDAMGDSPEPTIGLESRQMVRARGCFAHPQLNSMCFTSCAVDVFWRRLYLHKDCGCGHRMLYFRVASKPSTEPPGAVITVRGFEGGPDRLARLHLL